MSNARHPRHLVARHRRSGELVALRVADGRLVGALRLLARDLPEVAELPELAYRDELAGRIGNQLAAEYELWEPIPLS